MKRWGLLSVLAMLLVLPQTASASQLVDRNATGIHLQVNKNGVALVTYSLHDGSRPHHVLYWGAINWTIAFKYDRSGGWKSHVADWKHFHNVCRPYTGPALSALVTACTAPDGSFWALQQWVRIKQDWGGRTGAQELYVSHWTGAAPVIWVKSDWQWHGTYVYMYGQYTFHGRPVVAHKVTSTGYVLDGIGRNVAVDSWNSDFGPGWARVNMFLTHEPHGQFCYDFSPKGHGPHTGKSPTGQYRISSTGPGVGPDPVNVPFAGQTGPFDPVIQAAALLEIAQLNHGAAPGCPCYDAFRNR